MKIWFGIFLFCFGFFSCAIDHSSVNSSSTKEGTYGLEIKEMSDPEYPDNPDIGFRASDYDFDYFKSGRVLRNGENAFDLELISLNEDTLHLKNLDIKNWLPTVPNALKKDEYLTKLALINQEWNRNQVKFKEDEFYSSTPKITRLDVARNCLNSELWEVIPYIQENILRTVTSSKAVNYSDLSDSPYPLAGARLKKKKEIIHPDSFQTMRDLQSDSTTLATFSPPGFYNRNDPRKTKLGRFKQLDSVIVNTTDSKMSTGLFTELKLFFSDAERKTVLTIGGLKTSDFPVLAEEEANAGWKNSMGFGNHTFYEDFTTHKEVNAAQNPYYAYLSDENGNWLDSHLIGIDGPIFHLDIEGSSVLHLWLLSFERHALVGHYTLELP